MKVHHNFISKVKGAFHQLATGTKVLGFSDECLSLCDIVIIFLILIYCQYLSTAGL